jgi:hypothetical protein
MNNADKTNKNKQLMRTTAIGIGIAGLVWDTIVNQPMNLTSLILYFSALALFGYSFLYKRKK